MIFALFSIILIIIDTKERGNKGNWMEIAINIFARKINGFYVFIKMEFFRLFFNKVKVYLLHVFSYPYLSIIIFHIFDINIAKKKNSKIELY